MSFALAQLVRDHARTRPDAAAVSYEGHRLTFADLHARSSQVANALLAAGVGAGDRVGVLDKNSPTFFEVLFGCAKIGAVVVGLNWRLAPPEIAAILADAGVSVLLVGPQQRALLPAGPAGYRCVVLGPDYERWVTAAPTSDPCRPAGGDQPLLQLYSSGTTGVPKGAVLTHANLEFTVRMAGTTWRMGPDSVNLVPSPLFHIGGAGYGLTALSQGGHTVLVRDAAPAVLLEAIQAHRVTHAFLVPAVVHSLLEAPEVGRTDLSSLRLVGYGAAPMSEALLLRAIKVLGCQFLGVYGMTETAGTVLVLEPEDHDPGGPRAHLLRSVGRPLPWVEIAIKDPVSGQEVAPGAVGEIWVRSGQNMAGYWGSPAGAEGVPDAPGWLRTGDAAHRDDEGFVFLHDRLKDMIISGRENVYPAEVENVLADHPAVAEVAVIAVPHPRWGETVKAVVVARPGRQVGAEELIRFARSRLAGYKCPTSVDFLAALPRNPAGKVLKRQLRAPYWQTEPAR